MTRLVIINFCYQSDRGHVVHFPRSLICTHLGKLQWTKGTILGKVVIKKNTLPEKVTLMTESETLAIFRIQRAPKLGRHRSIHKRCLKMRSRPSPGNRMIRDECV